MARTKILAWACTAFLFVPSCKKDNTPNGTSLSNILPKSTWRITVFNDGGDDETSDFAGYHFTFNANGTASAANNASTTNGTWNAGVDDSQDKLYLNFGNTNPFEELNEDWRIVELNDVKVRLNHQSGGSGETDLLTFERN